MRTFPGLSLLLAVLLIAAGCSDDGDETTSPPTGSAAVLPSTSTTAAAPVDEGTVVASLRGEDLGSVELGTISLELGVTLTSGLSSWVLFSAMEEVLEEKGRPVNDADIIRAEAEVGLAIDESALARFSAINFAAFGYAQDEAQLRVVDAAPPEVLCSSHILLETEAEAADVAALAQDGEDFAELAMTYSTGPSGPSGGDLGCVTTATFVPEFGDGARANGPGVTDPVESQFGWHVIQVRSIGPGTVANHPELTSADEDRFRQETVNVEADAIVQEIVREASALVGAEAVIDPSSGAWDEVSAQLVG